MDNTLLELHKEWMEKGRLPESGLCDSLPCSFKSGFFNVMRPTYCDSCEIEKEGKSGLYWGSDVHWNSDEKYYTYTPLRQTILLLFHEYINS